MFGGRLCRKKFVWKSELGFSFLFNYFTDQNCYLSLVSSKDAKGIVERCQQMKFYHKS